ncbi:hypothetical protein R1sor_001481 [Riccia sorocarpa]|uniref:Phospholipid-transporting ATPase n=1 Tax=Riccia sorocarpa TaxID=122646 RepID=A0ABD3GYP0_9MARC
MSSNEEEMEERAQKTESDTEKQQGHWKPKVDLMAEETTNYSPRKLETMLKEGFTPWTPISPSNADVPESSGTKPDYMPVEEGLSPRKIEVIPKEERPEVLDPISRPSVSASMAPEIRFERERREMSVSPARKTITDHSKDVEAITAVERAGLQSTIARKTVAPIAPLSFMERRELLRSISLVSKEPETPLWFSGDADTDVEADAEDGPETVDEQPEHHAPEPEFTMARPPPQPTAARSRFAPPPQDAASIPPAPSQSQAPSGSAPISGNQRVAPSELTRVLSKRVFPTPNLKDEEVLNPFSKKERKALVRSLSMAVTAQVAPLWTPDSGDARESDDGRPSDEESLKIPLILPPELEELKTPKKPKPAKRYRKVRAHVNDLARSHAVDSIEFCSNKVQSAKYSLSTFLPMNLFTQCCRAANLYFILIAALQLIPGLSPTSWGTTLGPLAFVLLLNATKEGLDDFKRNLSDRMVNKQKVDVVNKGQFLEMNWSSVVVGDIVRVKRDDEFPADLVFLSSSDPKGLAYIETSNLDGEPSLKTRNAFYKPTQASAEEEDESSLSIFSGLLIECELPNNRLYKFDGAINLQDYGKLPLDVRQILLRGATLRNTDWILGVVVYTGADTKFVRNMIPGQRKVTALEKNMNILVALVFLCQVALCIGLAVGRDLWSRRHTELVYAPYDIFAVQVGVAPSEIGAMFGRFLILLEQLIPISLYVTLELVKVLQSYYVDHDVQMYHEPTKTFARARTTSLNEELGQVQYVLTDKTGTLTQNLMAFVQCSVNGATYGSPIHVARASEDSKRPIVHTIIEDTNLQSVLKQIAEGSKEPAAKSCHAFFSHVAICHVIQPVERDYAKEQGADESAPGQAHEECMRYFGPSPDEEALVQGAAECGYKLKKRTGDELQVEMPGLGMQRFAVLATLEFTSERKRMSIICRDSRGRIKLYCKGAESAILKRLGRDQDEMIESTLKQLEEFARYGFRTLCMAERELSNAEYDQWAAQFRNASVALDERDEKVAAVAEEIERDLILLGATAVEDKLQAGVPETVTYLALAGIKVWVLTGDKLETSVSVGLTCNLLADSMHLFLISDSVQKSVPQMLRSMLDEAHRQQRSKMRNEGSYHSEMATVIEGISLSVALEDSNKIVFLQLCQLCRSVICCRVSPIQKAQVTRLVKEHTHGVILAIGDGANDVGMLKAAHIGVGIGGREGMAAVLASDYALTRFRHLRRLLLVHGRWSYKRNREVVIYAFYKNIVYVLGNVYFAFYSGFSAQSLHSAMEICTYNLVWTSILPFLFAIFDKDTSDCTAENNPQLYKETQSEGRAQFFWCMLGWVGMAIWDSIVTFFFPLAVTSHFYSSGATAGVWSLGVTTYTMVVFTVNLKQVSRMHNLTVVHYAALIFSTLVWVMLLAILPLMAEHLKQMPVVGLVGHVLTSSANFWLLLILCPVASFLPVGSLDIFRTRYAPEDAEVMREIEHGWIDGFYFTDAPDFVEHIPTPEPEIPPPPDTKKRRSGESAVLHVGETEAGEDDFDLDKPKPKLDEDEEGLQPRRLTWREVTNEDELEDLHTAESLGRYGRRRSSGFQMVTRHTDRTEVPVPLVQGPAPPARKSILFQSSDMKPALTLTQVRRKSRFGGMIPENPVSGSSVQTQEPPSIPVRTTAAAARGKEMSRERRERERKKRKEKEKMMEVESRLEASPMDRIKSKTQSLKPSGHGPARRGVAHAPRSAALHPKPLKHVDPAHHKSDSGSGSSSRTSSPSHTPRSPAPHPKKGSSKPTPTYETPPHSPRKSSRRSVPRSKPP